MQDISFVALAIVISIIVIIAMLVIRMRILTEGQRQQLDAAYTRNIREHGLNISDVQKLPNRILALDNTKRVVLYLNNSEGYVREDLVHLKKVSDSRIVEKRNHGGSAADASVREVVLSLLLKDGSEIGLPIYSQVHDGLNNRIPMARIAEHWQSRLKRALTARQEPYALDHAFA